jgi:hypothetical protein
VRKQSDAANFVVAHHTHIHTGRIHWPGVYFGAAVRGNQMSGVNESRLVVHSRDSGIVPPIVSVPDFAAILEVHILLQNCGARTQYELHSPLHFIHAIDVSDPNRRTAVGILDSSEVDGRDGAPGMPHREIHLDAHSNPGASKSNSSFLHRRVGVKHLLAT